MNGDLLLPTFNHWTWEWECWLEMAWQRTMTGSVSCDRVEMHAADWVSRFATICIFSHCNQCFWRSFLNNNYKSCQKPVTSWVCASWTRSFDGDWMRRRLAYSSSTSATTRWQACTWDWLICTYYLVLVGTGACDGRSRNTTTAIGKRLYINGANLLKLLTSVHVRLLELAFFIVN